MKKSNITIKILVLTLLLALTLPLLMACESRPIPADKLALTPVGTVDGREVYYEELYFLAKTYLPSLENKHGEDKDALRAALDETLREHIITNSAILRLCENEGLTYDEADEELQEVAQQTVDQLIATEFDGSRGDYRDGIAELGMTDHYLRFNACVDALYAKLPAIYAQKGLIPTEDDAIRTYVKNNFVRTWHVAVLVEEGESYEENRAKAEEALVHLQHGGSMYQAIKKYSEDYFLTTLDGYYFPRGTMDHAYEDAAFALEIGQTSGIVEATAVANQTSDTVTCFYIIERLALDETYINSHLTALSDTCSNALVASKLDEVTKALSFSPNDFYRSLDLTALEAPGDGADLTLILIIGGIVLAVGAAATVVVVIVIRKRNKKTRLPAKTK